MLNFDICADPLPVHEHPRANPLFSEKRKREMKREMKRERGMQGKRNMKRDR